MHTNRLDSGLRYVFKQINSSVAYCSLSIRCGARDEGKCSEGLAHFVEHVLFKGTKNKSSKQINSYLDKHGGELNAFTSKEEIVLYTTTLKEDVDKALGLLFEIVTSCVFPLNEIEKEKGVILEEISSYKDAPSEDIFDQFEKLAFSPHPLSRLILGSKKSVQNITREDIADFYARFFVPQRMVLSVLCREEGHMIDKKVAKYDRMYFHQCKKELGLEEIIARKPLNDHINVFDKTVHKHNAQANCVMGCFGPGLFDHRERLGVILLCNYIGGPAANSIFNSTIREKFGWAYSVECNYMQYCDGGLICISFGSDHENVEKCCNIIRKEIEKLRTREISPRKLSMIKKQLLGQIAISNDNFESLGMAFGKSLLYFDAIMEEQSKEIIMSLGGKDLQQIAIKYFDTSKMSRLIYL